MTIDVYDSKSKNWHSVIPFDSLGITKDDVAQAMGYGTDELSPPFADEIDALLDQATEHACIEIGYRLFAKEQVSLGRDEFTVDDQCFDTGRTIAGALRGSESVALYTATAGPGFEKWSKALLVKDELMLVYFLDALGSITVEKAAHLIEVEIDGWAKGQKQESTNAYSPGYCDWSVAEQHKLFSLLPKDFCGISLTDSALMQPTKSLSGVIGVGVKAKKRAYACSICTMETCFRRHTH